MRSPLNNRHPYSDDPYLRGLAVEQTACFGAHSTRSVICKECRLETECLAAVSLRKSAIAAEIEQAEVVARRAAEARQKKKEQQDSSIDELMKTMGGPPSLRTGLKGRFQPLPNAIMATADAQLETVCPQCQERIPKNQTCVWVEGEGIFHPNCINLPDDFDIGT